jgi:hypothetical protein
MYTFRNTPGYIGKFQRGFKFHACEGNLRWPRKGGSPTVPFPPLTINRRDPSEGHFWSPLARTRIPPLTPLLGWHDQPHCLYNQAYCPAHTLVRSRTTPRVAGLGTKNYCAGEDQQQFTRPDRPTHFKSWRRRAHVTQKRRYPPTKLHCVTI